VNKKNQKLQILSGWLVNDYLNDEFGSFEASWDRQVILLNIHLVNTQLIIKVIFYLDIYFIRYLFNIYSANNIEIIGLESS